MSSARSTLADRGGRASRAESGLGTPLRPAPTQRPGGVPEDSPGLSEATPWVKAHHHIPSPERARLSSAGGGGSGGRPRTSWCQGHSGPEASLWEGQVSPPVERVRSWVSGVAGVCDSSPGRGQARRWPERVPATGRLPRSRRPFGGPLGRAGPQAHAQCDTRSTTASCVDSKRGTCSI